jgi:hypothetical protein
MQMWTHFIAQGQMVNQQLFGSGDKVTGICSEEKIRTQASQVDSSPWQCPCAWCVKTSRVPG